jgi:regulator of protease activity HflC (stomatin/prohibitin superfamily)
MASDSMKKIAEAEEQATLIEAEAEAKANAIIADAERLSQLEGDEMAKAAEAEHRKLIQDAEKRRQDFEDEQRLACQSELLSLQDRVAEKIPGAVGYVRNILIGKE